MRAPYDREQAFVRIAAAPSGAGTQGQLTTRHARSRSTPAAGPIEPGKPAVQ
jgi:hypothetical protein